MFPDIISWGGPALITVIGGCLVGCMRMVVKSFARIVTDNSAAHAAMMEQLRGHEMTLAGHDMRLNAHSKEHQDIRLQLDSQEDEIDECRMRLTRLEERFTGHAERSHGAREASNGH